MHDVGNATSVGDVMKSRGKCRCILPCLESGYPDYILCFVGWGQNFFFSEVPQVSSMSTSSDPSLTEDQFQQLCDEASATMQQLSRSELQNLIDDGDAFNRVVSDLEKVSLSSRMLCYCNKMIQNVLFSLIWYCWLGSRKDIS